jgi:hypothetical protein
MGLGSLLVSIPKAGTHLVVAALVRCGYLEYGEGIVRSIEDRRALANQLLAAEPYRSLLDAHSYIAPDHLLWFVTQEALSRVKPPNGRHYMEGHPLDAVPGLRTALARLRHDQLFPSDVVFSVHELWHEEDRQDFLNEWADTGSPRLIFNYRDPRDQLISMIHFLRDSPIAGGPGKTFGPILRSFATEEEQLDYAIRCPTFPYRATYRMHAWMLRHPNILKLRFEDLVGPEGGGTTTAQCEAIARLAEFLNLSIDISAVASGLHGGTRTFRRGRRGGWEELFSQQTRRTFEREHGDMLAMYGYA